MSKYEKSIISDIILEILHLLDIEEDKSLSIQRCWNRSHRKIKQRKITIEVVARATANCTVIAAQHTGVFRVPERKKSQPKKNFWVKKRMAANFPNMAKIIKLEIEESQETPPKK